MIYGYARVSTRMQEKDGNSLEAQEQELKRLGAEKIFKEDRSGKSIDRPVFNELISILQPGDTLIVTKLDRMCRSLIQGMEIVNKLIEKDIAVYIGNIGRMDNTPSSKLIRSIFFAFAEFERDTLIERTQEGRALAKQRPGYQNGRPNKYTQDMLNHALDMLDNHSYSEVERFTGISKSTLVRQKKRRLIKNKHENTKY